MAISNHERVGKALDLLKAGLRPYFEREMRAAHGDKWIDEAGNAFRDGRLPRDAKGGVNWDTHALLSVMAGNWTLVFQKSWVRRNATWSKSCATRVMTGRIRNHFRPTTAIVHSIVSTGCSARSQQSRRPKSSVASKNCCGSALMSKRGRRRANSQLCQRKATRTRA